MIKAEGLPEGWRVKEYRMPNKGDYFWYQNRVCVASSSFIDQRIIIEKTQPRRIVLEETEESNAKFQDAWCTQHFSNGVILTQQPKKWREVKGTEEPKLSLSVDECKEAMRKLETFNVTDLSVKICRFLKEHS